MKSFNEFQEGVASLAIKGGSKLIPALMTGIGAAGTIMQATKKDNGDVIKPKKGESKKTKKLIDNLYKKQGEITKQRELIRNTEKQITKPKSGEKKKAKKVVDTFKKVRKIEGKTMMRNKEDMEILKKGPGDLVPKARKTYLDKLLRNLRKEEVMAAPTNSVGDGSNVALPPTHEPGIKKKKNKRGSGMKNRKKKTYAYGGYGSRKNWMV